MCHFHEVLITTEHSAQEALCSRGLVTEIHYCLVAASGAISDDCLSDGGEILSDKDIGFSRPSEEVLLKSIPIVPSQQASTVHNLRCRCFVWVSDSCEVGLFIDIR